ncbi:hypothetical protein RYA05_04080 [Pseudomonas syringae pv. actinidiae]|nr:hypothetical protein [Pseudomonas syringae pv. actinidiae]
MTLRQIITPKTHPDHETVGQTFKAHDGELYFCDSWEENLGFWMTHVDAPAERRDDKFGKFRRNVSEQAIGRTFHIVYKR